MGKLRQSRETLFGWQCSLRCTSPHVRALWIRWMCILCFCGYLAATKAMQSCTESGPIKCLSETWSLCLAFSFSSTQSYAAWTCNSQFQQLFCPQVKACVAALWKKIKQNNEVTLFYLLAALSADNNKCGNYHLFRHAVDMREEREREQSDN